MKATLIQLACAAIMSLGSILMAFNITWPSYSLIHLTSKESPFGYPISKAEESLIGAFPMLGGLITIFFCGFLSDTLGRKRTGIIGTLLLVLGWSLITTAKSVTQILIGRFLTGAFGGFQLIVNVAAVSEIVEPRLCGTLTALVVQSYAVGTLVSYLTGWLFSYEIVNYINLTLSVCLVVLLSFLKETPAFLLSKGREKEALESLKFYRGVKKTTQTVLDELAYIKSQGSQINNDPNNEITQLNEKQILEETENAGKDVNESNPWKILYNSKPLQRAVINNATNLVLLVFGGTIAVQAYAGHLFSKAAPGISPHMCSIILSVSFALGGVLSTIATEVIGRRVLMISSAATSAIFLAILASLLKWSWGPVWMVPTCVLGYCCSFQLGVASVPFVQMSESFASKMKSLVSVIGAGCMFIGNFIVLATFSFAVECFGLDGTFLMFSIICAATALITFLTTKETKGKSVKEIENMYARGYLYERCKK